MTDDIAQKIRERDAQRKTEPKQKPKPAPKTAPLKRVSDSFARAIERGRLRQQGLELPVPSPWQELNGTLGGGFWAGMHMLIAGTGVGKTQLCMQLTAHAATRHTPIPVGLIELELDEMQLALRLLGDNAGVSWSGAYLGKLHDDSYAKLDLSAQRLASLPVYCDFGDAMSWGPSRLRAMAASMRAAHPTGPILIVLDFLQLVGPDPGDDSRLDLRERIGRAAYAARMVSREYGASIILVSSTARENYGALASKMDKTGLRTLRSGLITERVVMNPEALIGTGKESGELEYAADSVTVLLRPQLTLGANHEHIDQVLARRGKVVVAATVKVRAGAPSWFALAFERGSFAALSTEAINSLGGSREDDDAEPEKTESDRSAEAVAIVRDAAARGETFKSVTAIALRMNGRKAQCIDAVKSALRDGRLSTGVDGFFRVQEKV